MASSSWHLSLSDVDKIIVNLRHHELPAAAIQIIIKCKLGIESEISRQDTAQRQMKVSISVWHPTFDNTISDDMIGQYIALGEMSQKHLDAMMLFTEQEIDTIKHVGFDVNCARSTQINNKDSWLI